VTGHTPPPLDYSKKAGKPKVGGKPNVGRWLATGEWKGVKRLQSAIADCQGENNALFGIRIVIHLINWPRDKEKENTKWKKASIRARFLRRERQLRSTR